MFGCAGACAQLGEWKKKKKSMKKSPGKNNSRAFATSLR
jgi:hypothetical protein